MKKNKFLRLASFMLIACLATCCAVGGTFAKYTTSSNANDSARVAKFGVTVTMTDYDVFKDNYDATVISSTTADDVVAPGTSGTLAGISISGTPEVKVEVKYEATLTLTGFDAYCPIVFTVGGVTYGIDGIKDSTGIEATNESADVAALITAVQNAIAAYTAKYNANTDLSTATAPKVSWEWAFDKNDDEKDTTLGNTAETGTAATIDLKIVTTVTQVD